MTCTFTRELPKYVAQGARVWKLEFVTLPSFQIGDRLQISVDTRRQDGWARLWRGDSLLSFTRLKLRPFHGERPPQIDAALALIKAKSVQS